MFSKAFATARAEVILLGCDFLRIQLRQVRLGGGHVGAQFRDPRGDDLGLEPVLEGLDLYLDPPFGRPR